MKNLSRVGVGLKPTNLFTFAGNMRFLRSSPWGLQLMMAMLLFIFMFFATPIVITALLPSVAGVTIEQIENINGSSTPKLIATGQVVQAILSISIFLATSVIFARLAHAEPLSYLGIRAPGKAIQPLLAILAMIFATPLLETIESLFTQYWHFSPELRRMQEANDAVSKAYLTMPTFTAFIRTFIIMALVPAVGEELFFRGLLFKFFKKGFSNIHIAALVNGVIFATFHGNVYGMVSICIAGMLLAGIYYATGSLWCSILGHLFFNGSQIILTYYSTNNKPIEDFLTTGITSPVVLIACTGISGLCFYLIYKYRTPVDEKWIDTFDIMGNNDGNKI